MKNFRASFYFILTLILFMVFVSSYCRMRDCTLGFTTVTFLNLYRADTDTFCLRCYKLYTRFSLKIDIAIYSNVENMNYVNIKRDTIALRPLDLNVSPFFIEEEVDFELVPLRIWKVGRITDVREENFEEKFCAMQRNLCYTSIRTANADGVTDSGSTLFKD